VRLIPVSPLVIAILLVLGGSVNAQTALPGTASQLETRSPLKRLIPGEEFLPAALRAQQADDFDNPAYPTVEVGEAFWGRTEGTAGKSCQDCHGAGQKNTVRRAAASYPKYAPDVKEVITLETRVNLCRQNNLGAPALQPGSEQMTALTAYLRWLAKGSPSSVEVTGPAAAIFERGAQLFQAKTGLLQLSCAQCHEERAGQKFGADTLSQGHPLAYPVFSVGETRMITLHERFRMCNKLARAEGQPDNSPNYVALELYLNWRSKDLPITAPGVRP
jgi:L-cysteine S-thiosulfotransferase